MYFYIVQPLVCKIVTRLHRASFGRSSSFSVNVHESWTAWYILFKFCILMYFKHCPATVMQNGNESSPSIIFAGRALLLKMLITLELRYALGSDFEYFFFFSFFIFFFIFLSFFYLSFFSIFALFLICFGVVVFLLFFLEGGGGCFLAHLSGRLIGELIGYSWSGVRRSSVVVQNAQRSSSPKPLGQSKPNFNRSLLG